MSRAQRGNGRIKAAQRFGLQYTLNPRGRPPEKAEAAREMMDVTFSEAVTFSESGEHAVPTVRRPRDFR
jgi:hypothetical protein